MRRVTTLSLCCLLAAVGLMLWGFAFTDRPGQAQQPGYSLLLVEEDTGSELYQLSRGLRESLSRHGGRSLRIARLADQPLDAASPLLSGAEGIFLLAGEPALLLQPLKALDRPVTVLMQAVEGEHCVLADDALGGRLLGGLAKGLPEGRLLVIGEPADPLQALRLQGIEAGLAGRGYGLVPPPMLTQDMLRGAAGVLCLSGEYLEQAAALLGGLSDDRPALYGFDAADSRVRLMEAGLLTAVTAQSPYALGFVAGQGVEGIRLVPPRLVAAEDLYLAENVQLMFPLLN